MTQSIAFSRLWPVLAALYLSQGLPGGLIAHAIPVMLRESGVSLAVIGGLKLLALPWLLKVLWAPWVDRIPSYRWRWITAMQVMTAGGILALAFLHAAFFSAVVPLVIILACVNLASATQDIGTDGIAAAYAEKSKLGIVNTLQVAGYKVGMLLGGSGFLYLTGFIGSDATFIVYALLLVALLCPLWRARALLERAPMPNGIQTNEVERQDEPTAWRQVFHGFFARRHIAAWLLLLLCYKLSDSLGSAMLKPMLVDLGYTRDFLASLTLYSTVAGLFGAALGGWLYLKLGARTMLLSACVLQGVSVSAFGLIPELSAIHVQWLVCAEQLCDGMSTVVLFAWMMRWCRHNHEGSDYTLQASIQILLAGILGAASGFVADSTSYSMLYGLCAAFSVFSMLTVIHFLMRWTEDTQQSAHG